MCLLHTRQERTMTLDPQLVDRARDAATELADAELAALLDRAHYHTAVRRLHLAGGSLREIAQALSLSHQRVQQIVSAAGGSWWQRVWRTRRSVRMRRVPGAHGRRATSPSSSRDRTSTSAIRAFARPNVRRRPRPTGLAVRAHGEKERHGPLRLLQPPRRRRSHAHHGRAGPCVHALPGHLQRHSRHGLTGR